MRFPFDMVLTAIQDTCMQWLDVHAALPWSRRAIKQGELHAVQQSCSDDALIQRARVVTKSYLKCFRRGAQRGRVQPGRRGLLRAALALREDGAQGLCAPRLPGPPTRAAATDR